MPSAQDLVAPLTAEAVPLCLDGSHDGCAALGALTFVRGVSLSSSHPGFHGLSSLSARAAAADQLLSVTDFGLWVTLPRSPQPGAASL